MTDLTEEERLEALKRWWKENGRSAVMGIALGVVVVAGWNVWQSRRTQAAEQASTVFQQMVVAEESKQPEAALKLSQRLIDQYGSTTYGLYGKLFAAKFKAQQGDLAGAKQLLEDVLAHGDSDNARDLARFRLAQVMLALKQEEEALKLIESADAKRASAYQGLYTELKGDILVALGRPAEARTVYEQARQQGQASPLLELKLQDLAVAPS